jgi:hypothetical protein
VSGPPAVSPVPDWQLRIRTSQGGTAGAGVLVSPRHVLTCAHVVCTALGLPWAEEDTPRPREPVTVDAPRGGGSWQATATVLDDGWFADRSPWDAAVLLLDRPAPADPPEMRLCGSEPGRAVSMVGFSHEAVPAGVWSRAVLVGHGGGRRFEYVQFDVTSSTTARVVHGFSGSGVREHPGGALIGIVCDAMRDDRGLGASGWLIPIEAVPRVWGDRSAAQPPSREPDSPRLVHRLAEALASTPTIADPEARKSWCALLDERIRKRIHVGRAPLFFAFDLVDVARDYGLLGEVLDTLAMVEEGSRQMRQVREAAEALGER